jgi:hypothetical protein
MCDFARAWHNLRCRGHHEYDPTNVCVRMRNRASNRALAGVSFARVSLIRVSQRSESAGALTSACLCLMMARGVDVIGR